MSDVEEFLALDLLTLREHTERAGDRLDPAQQADRLRESLPESELCTVRRHGALVAYAMLRPMAGSSWFVLGFNTHPAHRSTTVMRELLAALATLAQRKGITDLRSHVYKTNGLSMAFHRRLGFCITKENEKGVEFFATTQDLARHAVFRGAQGA
jgi:ribosomal protein S18 acetylase RimI-like enzyme